MSPFTSAMKTGTPMSLNDSAITFRVTVLPVPVAPATSPCRLAIPGSRKSGSPAAFCAIWIFPSLSMLFLLIPDAGFHLDPHSAVTAQPYRGSSSAVTIRGLTARQTTHSVRHSLRERRAGRCRHFLFSASPGVYFLLFPDRRQNRFHGHIAGQG